MITIFQVVAVVAGKLCSSFTLYVNITGAWCCGTGVWYITIVCVHVESMCDEGRVCLRGEVYEWDKEYAFQCSARPTPLS